MRFFLLHTKQALKKTQHKPHYPPQNYFLPKPAPKDNGSLFNGGPLPSLPTAELARFLLLPPPFGMIKDPREGRGCSSPRGERLPVGAHCGEELPAGATRLPEEGVVTCWPDVASWGAWERERLRWEEVSSTERISVSSSSSFALVLFFFLVFVSIIPRVSVMICKTNFKNTAGKV